MTPIQIIRAAMAELESLGYGVVFEDGWETRTVGGTFDPQGFLFHHTATSASARGDYPSLGIVRDGVNQRGGYFLPGPLSQFGGGRSGTIYVIAAGKANHAGPGGWNGLSGNYSVWGCEFENNGAGEPWPVAQVDAGIALAAALAKYTGFDADMCCRHAEWSSAGKIDTATAPMNDGDWLRARVAARLVDDIGPVPEEDELTDEEHAWLQRLAQRIPDADRTNDERFAMLNGTIDAVKADVAAIKAAVLGKAGSVTAAAVQPDEPLSCAEGD